MPKTARAPRPKGRPRLSDAEKLRRGTLKPQRAAIGGPGALWVTCRQCGAVFDIEHCWTMCPHDRLRGRKRHA